MIKRLTGGREAMRTYHWRPSFRDFEALPDIRAVRTKFFVPTLFISLAIIAASLTVFREHKAMVRQKAIDELQTEVDSYKEEHDAIVALNGEFMKRVRGIDEIIAFTEGQLVASDFFLGISSNAQKGMYLSRVEYTEEKATIAGFLSVAAEEASQVVDDYMKALSEADVLQGKMTEYKLTSLIRLEKTDTIQFRIEVTPEGSGKGKARR